jgi:protoporphyrinogen oxidase
MANKKVIVGAGMGSFPKALAAKVNVKLESPVQTIEARDDGVVVQLSGEQMCADHVVLAATRANSLPHFESAIETGMWCADQIIHQPNP